LYPVFNREQYKNSLSPPPYTCVQGRPLRKGEITFQPLAPALSPVRIPHLTADSPTSQCRPESRFHQDEWITVIKSPNTKFIPLFFKERLGEITSFIATKSPLQSSLTFTIISLQRGGLRIVKDAVDSGCRTHGGPWGVRSRDGAVRYVVRIHPLALKHAGACSRHRNIVVA